MNGNQAPTATQPPPSVQRARQHGRREATRIGPKQIGLTLLALVGLGFLAVQIMTHLQHKPGTSTHQTETTLEPHWGRQTFHYEEEKPPPPQPPKPPEDKITPALAELKAKLAKLEEEMKGLKQQKPPPAPQKEKPPPKVTREAAPLLFVSHALDDKHVPPPKSTVREHLLIPGTFLPCALETKINSEVEGPFKALVNQTVYDTATGYYPLVPQGSTILATTNSSELLHGNERMNTVSLSLSFRDGRTIELGHAPVTDQEGVTGLTGDVDQRYWQLFKAVFIGGALKGGMQAMQTGMMQAAGAGQVASGIATYGSQATQQKVGRALDTRPIIKVPFAQGCHVLLTKPLTLPALW